MNYCRILNGPGNRIIDAFVRRGGAYLGFCAGGYYGSARCEFEVGHADTGMEVIGTRELAFFPGTCRGGAFKGFRYASEAGARVAKLSVRKEAFEGLRDVPQGFRSYYNGGGVFVDAAKMKDKGIEVLATFMDELAVDSGEGKAALVYCKVGSGGVILTGPHPEYVSVNKYFTSYGTEMTYKVTTDSAPSTSSHTQTSKGTTHSSMLWLRMMSTAPPSSKLVCLSLVSR